MALVEAKPDKHKRDRPASRRIEGKTWNHPVIAHGKLFVRNAEEVACFELAPVTGEARLLPAASDLRRSPRGRLRRPAAYQPEARARDSRRCSLAPRLGLVLIADRHAGTPP